MAVTLKLSRGGKPHLPIYRIVVSEKGTKRDGKFIEIVGQYYPHSDPARITLKEDRVRHWVSVGAQTTEIVRNLIERTFPGLITEREKHALSKLQAARKKRKARLAGKPDAKKAAKREAKKAPKKKTVKKKA